MSSLRALILGTQRRREPVPVSEWGVTVYAVAMPGLWRARFEKEYAARKTGEKDADALTLMAVLVLYATEDEAGKPVFPIQDEAGTPVFPAQDFAWLTKECEFKNLNQVYEKCAELNALRKEDAEDARKNSPIAPPSDSPAT